MNRKDIEKLKKLAVKVAEAHEKCDGLCGLHPYADWKNGKLDSPHIQLAEDAFFGNFKNYEVAGRGDAGYEVFVIEDGVKIFTTVDAEEEVE